jgi:hypothetical protein
MSWTSSRDVGVVAGLGGRQVLGLAHFLYRLGVLAEHRVGAGLMQPEAGPPVVGGQVPGLDLIGVGERGFGFACFDGQAGTPYVTGVVLGCTRECRAERGAGGPQG